MAVENFDEVVVAQVRVVHLRSSHSLQDTVVEVLVQQIRHLRLLEAQVPLVMGWHTTMPRQ